jgi:hypothetical protein
MTSIAVVAHHERSTARSLTEEAAAWCTDYGVTFWMPVDDAEALDLVEWASLRPVAEADPRAQPRWRWHDAAHRATARGSAGAGPRRQPRLARLPHAGRTRSARRGARSVHGRLGVGRMEARSAHDARRCRERCPRGTRPQRSGGGEGCIGAHGAVAGTHRWRAVHVLRGRRTDRCHSDRIDRLLVVGAWAGRVTEASSDAADTGVTAHALRSDTRARPVPRPSRSRCPAIGWPNWCSTASRLRRSTTATSWPVLRRTRRRTSSASAASTITRS